MDSVETIEFEYGIRGIIHYEEDMNSPRKEYDHASTMLCAHSRYDLGDETVSGEGEIIQMIAGEVGVELVCVNCGKEVEDNYGSYIHSDEGADDSEFTSSCGGEEIEPLLQGVEMLPLYLYDHSGLTMNTGGFNCPWDSGQVGIVYMTHKQILECFAVKEINDQVLQEARELMIAEVKEYDSYLRGDVYWYEIVDEEGERLDSCGGYIGFEHVEEEVKSQGKWFEDQEREVRALVSQSLSQIAEIGES